MKRIIALLVSICLMVSLIPSFTAFAAGGTTGECTWSLNGSVLTISGNGKTASYNSLGERPWGKQITSLVIESGVTAIGNFVFAGSTNLGSVSFPSTLKTIGDYAFSSCGISSLSFPAGLAGIGNFAFSQCNNIKNVSLPASIISLGGGAFSSCKSLGSVSVDSSNAVYYSAQNNIIERVGKKIVCGSKNSTIPSDGSVTSIADYAFYGCSELTSLSIPHTVTEIGKYSFGGCSGIKRIKLPESIVKIGEFAFAECALLTNVTLSKNLSVVPSDAFSYCGELSVITVPLSVKTVEMSAFEYCNALESVFYEGNSTQWSAVKIDQYNDSLKSAKVYYNSSPDGNSYPDVLKTGWYYEAVEYVTEKDYFSGYSDGTFGPANNISRQDFIVALARIDKADLSKYTGRSNFVDVQPDSYYERAVIWAFDNNIITGYNDGRFGVGDNMTREQLVTVLFRYAKQKEYDINYSEEKAKNYLDYVRVSDFAKQAICWALDKGVMNGMDAQNIGPFGNASRAHVAQMLKNTHDKGIMPI